MNKSISLISDGLQKLFPKAQISIDAPERDCGQWFIDISYEGKAVSLEYRPGIGFGISANKQSAFGEQSDFVTDDPHEALRKSAFFLMSGEASCPPIAVRLHELRSSRGFSQEQLAEALKIRQSAISKLEKRQDVRVNTLRQAVQAMGGHLRIVAEFSDGIRDIKFDEVSEFRPTKPSRGS